MARTGSLHSQVKQLVCNCSHCKEEREEEREIGAGDATSQEKCETLRMRETFYSAVLVAPAMSALPVFDSRCLRINDVVT